MNLAAKPSRKTKFVPKKCLPASHNSAENKWKQKAHQKIEQAFRSGFQPTKSIPKIQSILGNDLFAEGLAGTWWTGGNKYLRLVQFVANQFRGLKKGHVTQFN